MKRFLFSSCSRWMKNLRYFYEQIQRYLVRGGLRIDTFEAIQKQFKQKMHVYKKDRLLQFDGGVCLNYYLFVFSFHLLICYE